MNFLSVPRQTFYHFLEIFILWNFVSPLNANDKAVAGTVCEGNIGVHGNTREMYVTLLAVVTAARFVFYFSNGGGRKKALTIGIVVLSVDLFLFLKDTL